MSTVVVEQPPQHEIARARANQIRGEMSACKRVIAALPRVEGMLAVAEWLENPDEIVARIRLGQLLAAIHRVGTTKVPLLLPRDLMPGALSRRIGPLDCTAGGEIALTERQRLAMAEALRAKAASCW